MRLPLALLLITLLPSSASATRVLSMDLHSMVATADVVVHGRVVHTESVAVTDAGQVLDVDAAAGGGHGRLRYETRVDLELIESVKWTATKAPPLRVSFHLAGGRVGRYAQVVAGSPRVAIGDELVVLLERTPGDILRVVGFSQGLWRSASLIGLAPLARSDRTGAELVPGADGLVAPSVEVRPLGALLVELRRLVKVAPSPVAVPR